MKPTIHLKRRHILIRLLLSLTAVIILLPIVITALYSFFSPDEIKAFMDTRSSYDAAQFMEIKLSPNMFSLSQYYKILIEDMTILRYFVNSAMYTGAILLGQALFIPAMAYALSRFRFPGRDALFFVIIMLMLLPFQVTMVPNVITLRAMGLLDTVWSVILPMTVAPFYIFLLRQYMVGLPNDMIEAAQIDGAGTLRCFVHVVMPAHLGRGDCAVVCGLLESGRAAAHLSDDAYGALSAVRRVQPADSEKHGRGVRGRGAVYTAGTVHLSVLPERYSGRRTADGAEIE